MNDNGSEMERRLRLSAILLIFGLVVDVLSLLWNHPLTFLAFMLVGCLFEFLGIAVYLASLVFATSPGFSAEPSRAHDAGLK